MDSDVDIAPSLRERSDGNRASPPRPDGDKGAEGAEGPDGLRAALRVTSHALIAGLPVALLGVVALVLRPEITAALDNRAVAAWRTVFTAIVIQGVPFLLLGTLVSAAISAFVPAWVFTRVLPRNPALAVPVAGVAGAVLPASVSPDSSPPAITAPGTSAASPSAAAPPTRRCGRCACTGPRPRPPTPGCPSPAPGTPPESSVRTTRVRPWTPRQSSASPLPRTPTTTWWSAARVADVLAACVSPRPSARGFAVSGVPVRGASGQWSSQWSPCWAWRCPSWT